MGRRNQVQDATGIVSTRENGDVLIAAGDTVPTDGDVGYATGCIFIHTDGGAGTALYTNEGTNASADVDAVSVA